MPTYRLNNSMLFRKDKYSQVEVEKINKVFADIPRDTTVVNLASSWLFDIQAGFSEFSSAVEQLPRGIIDLSLADTKLGYIHPDYIGDFFSALPPALTTLDLQSNKLGLYTGDKLKTILSSLPKTVRTLGLRKNDLYEDLGKGRAKSAADLAACLAALSPSVDTLDLSSNILGLYSGDELGMILAALPKTVTALDLSDNSLGSCGEGCAFAELEAVFSKLPKTVTTLNLSGNYLLSRNRDVATTKRVIAAIPDTVTALDLGSMCPRPNYDQSEFAAIISALPRSVTRLKINGVTYGNFGDFVADHKVVFSAISPAVTMLDLSYGNNWFERRSIAEVAEAFSYLPDSVTEIDLSGQTAGNKTIAELKPLFDCLYRKGIRSLGKRDSELQYKYSSYISYIKGNSFALCQVIYNAVTDIRERLVVDDKESIEHSFVQFLKKNPGLDKSIGGRIASYVVPEHIVKPPLIAEDQLGAAGDLLGEVPETKDAPAPRCSVFSTPGAKISVIVGCDTVFIGLIAAIVTASIVASSTGVGLPIGIACAVAAAVLGLWLGVTAGVERACMAPSP